MQKKTILYFLISIILLVLTILVPFLINSLNPAFVEISDPATPGYPRITSVINSHTYSLGLSTFNLTVHSALGGFNHLYYQISQVLGVPVIAVAAILVAHGLCLFCKKKSLKSLPREFYCLLGLYFVLVLVYVFFDHFSINYRPVLMDGEMELSYPSSHTLLAATVCGSAIIVLPYLFPNLNLAQRRLINLALYIFLFSTIAFRFLSGVHWATDIFGGLLTSCTLLSFFYLSISYKPDKRR